MKRILRTSPSLLQLCTAVSLCIIIISLPPLVFSLRIKSRGDDSEGGEIRDHITQGITITASPTLIYRRRLNSDRDGRYQPSIYPPPTAPSNSIEEIKTESDSADNNGNGPLQARTNSGEEETYSRYPPTTTTTTRTGRIRPKKSKPSGNGQRRHRSRSRLRTVAVPEQELPPNEQAQASVEQYTTSSKPVKTKSGRRRKVKRPSSKKQPLKESPASNEVVGGGDENKASNSTGGSSGDKNLALEIGSEDGKYALIDKFFDNKPSLRPGLVSYAASDDFPRNDNKYTLGNVKENDIWLSDGHLLVLKGGDLDASLREHWKPIDNYQRGNRPPLRIALDSDNPPPFPVFVNETGPPVFLGPPPPPFLGYPYPPPGSLGNNETFDPSRFPPPGMVPLYPNGTIPDYYRLPPSGGTQFGGGNNSLFPQGRPPPQGQYGGGGYGQQGQNVNGTYPPPPQGGPYPFPFLPPPGFNRTGGGGPGPGPHPGQYPGGGPNGPPPGYPFLPPLVLNPHDNETDDPSIFLPPPYDFDYHDDNTTIVPPGPFAPGLVVPPPKNFYTVYNKSSGGRRPTNTPATQPPPIGLSYSFGNKRIPYQRPNGKKPQKFPITNPPDDSEEAYRPLVTTPLPAYPPYRPQPNLNQNLHPYEPELPLAVLTPSPKKRKQRPGVKVVNKGSKYEADTELGHKVIASPPVEQERVAFITPAPPPQLVQQPVEEEPQPPLINFPVITNTIAPILVSSPKPQQQQPLNNYVYVRGQLKSLAELQSQDDEYDDDGRGQGGGGGREPTPRPPYDEQGYPTRVIDDENNDPVILQYNNHHKKPTAVPDKSVYYPNTPKYDAIYNNGGGGVNSGSSAGVYNNKKPKKLQNLNQNQYFSSINQQQQNEHQLPHHHQRPTVNTRPPQTIVQINQQSPQPVPIYHNSNRLSNQNLNQNLYPYNNNFQQKVTPIPHYYNNHNNNNNNARQPGQKHGIIQLQSPKSNYNSPRQPILYNNNNNNNQNQQNLNNYNAYNNGVAVGGFRPAFGPTTATIQPQIQQQLGVNGGVNGARGNKALFPGQVRQNGPIFDFQNPYFNQNQGQQGGQNQQPQVDGYYSPLTQYYQPFQTEGGVGGGQQNNLNFFQNSPQRYFNQQNQNSLLNPYQQQQQQQPFQPYFGQQSQQQSQRNGGVGGQSLTNTDYRSPLFNQFQQQQSPLRQDLYVNYREPLPQYNTESEAVTTRTLAANSAAAAAAFRAGPSKSPPLTGAESKTKTAQSSSPSVGVGQGAAVPPPADGTSSSYYSFQRGGPGGFSYKIKL